ncbi:MAG: substrate-binding domain-containing protein [Clostridiales bacterium]|nr:substrate-binding domain-containing protein [Clostridiales bacterium]
MRRTPYLIPAAALLLGLCGCQSQPAAVPSAPATPAPGQFVFTRDNFPRLDGSTATVPLGQAVASVLLGESREEVSDLIQFNKTSRAYYNLVDGNADLLIVAEGGEDSYAYRDEHGKSWRMEPIAAETLVFFVNEDNPVDGLTLDQVRDIYSGKITNWSEVGGSDAPIQPYQRPKGGGSQAIMDKEVMGDIPMMEPFNTDYVVSSMEGIIEAVRAWDDRPDAIGYTVYYYADDMGMADGLKLLSIDGVAPNDGTIRSGEYPIHTAYYAVMDAGTPEGSPTAVLFDWLLSQEGQDLIDHEGYVSVLEPSR